MLTIEQQQLVTDCTKQWLQKASDLYGIRLPVAQIEFNLRGVSAGQFATNGKVLRLRFNPWLFAAYFEENLAQTIPHEVAHLITFVRFGQRVKPHGREWKACMQDFGRPALTTHRFDVSDIPRRNTRRYTYRCGCQQHQLTAIRHNRILKGASYLCRSCRQPLIADSLSE